MLSTNQLIMIAVAALISAFGGFVQWVRKDAQFHTTMELVKTVSTGIFTGILVFVALTTTEMNNLLRYVLAGLASYVGGSILDLSAGVATKVIEKKVGEIGTSTSLSTVNQPATPQQSKAQPDPVNSGIPVDSGVPRGKRGEVSLEAFQNSVGKDDSSQQPVEEQKPKRKRAPRKKKTEEGVVTTAPSLPAVPTVTSPVDTTLATN